ncbi:hypothetical protein E2C01_031131 [Portunus trituberculatus]|uniref:Uncharacterized protein n=1 Tax=Portunus trituberculatus TaxID=210409 RepID=A0A5B7EZ96_PORTR|nr:hypothetical protein [Portunus trituberculatus]
MKCNSSTPLLFSPISYYEEEEEEKNKEEEEEVEEEEEEEEYLEIYRKNESNIISGNDATHCYLASPFSKFSHHALVLIYNVSCSVTVEIIRANNCHE